MGTDCKSAAFSFGGSNPPAPTKKTSVENTLVFFFCKNPKAHPRGWIRTAAARRFTSRRAKKPRWGFLAARLAETPAPTKKISVENTLVFFFCKNPKTHPRGWIRTAAARRFTSRRAKKPRWGFFSSAACRTARAHQKSATPLVPDPLRHFASEMPPLPKGEALAVRNGLLAFPAQQPHHCQGYGCLLYKENHPQNGWFSLYNKAETVQDRLCHMFYTAKPGAMPEKAQPSIRLLPVISAGTGRPT